MYWYLQNPPQVYLLELKISTLFNALIQTEKLDTVFHGSSEFNL